MIDPIATLRAAVEAHDGPRCGKMFNVGFDDDGDPLVPWPCGRHEGHDLLCSRWPDMAPSWDVLRGVLEAVDALAARVRELEAALANERGEGEPPSEGWQFRLENSEPIWQRLPGNDIHADVTPTEARGGADGGWEDARGWHWWVVTAPGGSYDGVRPDAVRADGFAPTAREAMVQADAALLNLPATQPREK